MNNCLNCNKPFTTRWQKKFCSQSCAAQYNNILYPKRKTSTQHTCACGGRKAKRAKRCKECRSKTHLARTLSDAECKRGMGSQRWQAVRFNAKQVMQEADIEKKCSVCGWGIHVEVAHIKPISEFPRDTLVSEVNSLDNLVYLCPNCHWMFDHNMLVLVRRE